MRTPEQVIELYEWRRSRKPLQKELQDLRDLNRGAIIVPLNELDASAKSSVANLTRQGLEQMAMRGASTMPQTVFLRSATGSPDRAKERARTKSQAVRSWWDENNMGLKLRKRMRHLWGYAASPVVIRPDFKKGHPVWQIRDPLATYPAQRYDEQDPVPEDCIFAMAWPWSWIRHVYPGTDVHRLDDLEMRYGVYDLSRASSDRTYEVIEYVDAEQIMLIALAGNYRATGGHMVLDWVPNKAGRPLAVVPELISLDESRSPYADMPGLHYNAAYLQALNLIAVERGIFPTEWLVDSGTGPAQVITNPDPKRGIIGQIRGGTILTQQINPGYKTDTMMVQLERAQRLEAGIPAEFAGEASSTVRTARRGDQILSAAVDFRVQEIQDIIASSLIAENQCAIALDKACWGKDPKSFYFTSAKDVRQVDYVPDKLWDTDRHIVKYSLAGADVNTLTITVGGLLGTGLISKEYGREVHPLVEDPEGVADQIRAEQVEDAAMAFVQQTVAAGEWTPDDMALFQRLVVTQNKPIYEALEQVQRAAQERQQAIAAQEAPPEMAQPGVGPGEAVAPGPAVGEVSAGVSNVANLVSRLNRPRQVANTLQEAG